MINASRFTDPRLVVFFAMSDIIGHFITSVNIRTILIVSRTSPPRARGFTSRIAREPSLTRQSTFCSMIVRGLYTPCTYLELDQVSAYQDDTLSRLHSRLQDESDVLILTPSLDRLSRNSAHIDRIVELQQRNVWTMCLLWPQSLFTFPETEEQVAHHVRTLPEGRQQYTSLLRWFGQQSAFRNMESNIPLIMPTVINLEVPRIENMVRSTIHHAEAFVSALRAPVYSGVEVPATMERRQSQDTFRGMTDELAQTWQTTISDITQVPLHQIRMRHYNSQTNNQCRCSEQADHIHSRLCRCICNFCQSQREQYCPCQHLQICVCSIVCICPCRTLCHRNSKYSRVTSRLPDLDQNTPPD